jgi:hypothetical protein
MNPETAATIIQNAWRRFDERRIDKYRAEYEKELQDTYYRSCCDPISWREFYPERPVDYEGMYEVVSHYNDLMDLEDPPDDWTFP